MRLSQVGVVVGVAAGIAASAALVRWPYNLIAEAVLALSALVAVAAFIAWIISLFYRRIKETWKTVTIVSAGSLLGAYLATAGLYFSGFIGYNYPASQDRIHAQESIIADLMQWVDGFRGKLAETERQLTDAKGAMADPGSAPKPSYTLLTALKLQFDDKGEAQALESHNVVWDTAAIPQARQVGTVAPVPKEVASDQPAVNCSNFANITDPRCQSLGFLQYGTQCPKMACSEVPTYETSNAYLLMLSFPYPVSASTVSIEPHGANVPEHKILGLSEHDAVVLFENRPRNMVVDVGVSQKTQ